MEDAKHGPVGRSADNTSSSSSSGKFVLRSFT
jgi:hypothetical protein